MNKEIMILEAIFKNNANKEALVGLSSAKTFSYRELEVLSLKLAQVLQKNGIVKGDRIGIILPNSVEYVIIYIAIMQIGAIAVPINHDLHPTEIISLINNSKVKLVFMPKRNEAIESVAGQVYIVNELFLGEIEREKAISERSFSCVDAEDVIAIMYTSGTTSRPKGVEIRYRDVIGNGLAFIETMKIPAGTRFLNVFSLSYMGGWFNQMLIPLLSGGTIILDKTFGSDTALSYWNKVINNNVSAIWLTPTMMAILLFIGKAKEALEYNKKHVKFAFVGTAPLAPKIKRDFEESSGINFYENYGLSETFFISTNIPGLPPKIASVGKVLPGCEIEIRIKSGEKGKIGDEGEIFVKSAYLMKGYYDECSSVQLMDVRGFFRTGDIGFIDEEGYLFITGREKDLIIRGGLNVSPKQIEDKLMEMEGIEEVACVGVPHNIYGEEIAVVVKLKAQHRSVIKENDILEFAAKSLAQSKYPRLVYFVDDFPRSSTGKLQKNKLRLMLQEKNKG